MIAEIKKKYIGAVMVSVIAVLVVIVTLINVLNFVISDERSNIRIDFIARTENLFPTVDDEPENPDDENGGENNSQDGIIDEETPFDTRFFTVTLRTDGAILGADIQRVARVSKNEAIKYAVEAFNSNDGDGYFKDYKFRAIHHEDKIIYIFLDASRELEAVRSFLVSSIVISLLGAMIIFVLIVVLANSIFRPIIESYEKQKRFITDAGHELKTPLSIIEANAEVIEMENGESNWTDSIKKQTKRLAKLTENLVYLSRMEESVSTTHSVFSLTDTVAEIAESWRAVAETKNKSLVYYCEPDIFINGSTNDISQLVSILLDNAMKYSSNAGDITLNLEKTVTGAEITLTNPVDEIETGNLSMLFNRFYRRDNSRNSGKGGFGIGLSLAKSIVQNHKGKISAWSADGKSIVFTVTFQRELP